MAEATENLIAPNKKPIAKPAKKNWESRPIIAEPTVEFVKE